MHRGIHVSVLALALIAASAIGTSASAAPAKYGCFKVTADGLNIRSRPYSNATIIGTAGKGDVLEKRKRWCTPRGYWCAVRAGGLAGYADTAFMVKTPCP